MFLSYLSPSQYLPSFLRVIAEYVFSYFLMIAVFLVDEKRNNGCVWSLPNQHVTKKKLEKGTIK